MKIVAISRNQDMVKIGANESTAKWYFLSAPVEKFIKSGGIKRGDEVNFKAEKQSKGQTIIFIKKGAGEAQPDEPTATNVPTCEVCGKQLKDAKYKKCYICNKKAKETPKEEHETFPEYTCSKCGKELKDNKYEKCYQCAQEDFKSGGTTKSNFDSELSKNQTILHATSRALIALQGQVDISNIEEVIDKLHSKFKRLI